MGCNASQIIWIGFILLSQIGEKMRLEKKVAIVTGASRGIGLATAVRFAEEGAIVIAADMDLETEELKAATSNSDKITPIHLNVADRASVDLVIKETLDKHGRIDAVVNNAGIVRDARLVKMTEEQFDAVIAVNLKGVYNCTQAVAPIMVEQKSGAILNASSVVGLYGNFGQTNYVASKAGVIGMTKVWARELGPKGVRVNAVAPGFIETRMTSGMPDKVLEKVLERIPLRYMGSPLDIANAYLWLASDEARYVNGHVLSVDGGATL